jgi:hypothetical protein
MALSFNKLITYNHTCQVTRFVGSHPEIELVTLISLNTRQDTDFTMMTRNHPELVQILEIFIYSENTGILPIERTTIRMVNYNQH